MSRLLIRTGKSPFTAVTPESTLTQDVFNSNTGNFLFQHAVWESLDIDGAELTANSTLSERRKSSDADIAAVNEKFDHFVVPFANAFRPDFVKQLDRLSDSIERLTIPVSVVGVGAQAPASMSLEDLAPIREATKRFVSAVLDRSPSIGVRGEFTAKFLADLGFGSEHVDIIGCPSLFRCGPDYRVEKNAASLPEDAALALNLTPEVPGIGQFSLEQAEKNRRLTYIAQDGHDLRLLLWGVTRPNVSDLNAPIHISHPLYRDGRMLMFVDQWTWFDYLSRQDFAYGTRFHGNVAALMAGIPAMLLAHDSRTIELADYHQMPHRTVTKFTEPISAAELYEQTDLTAFNEAIPKGFARYRAFLERHHLHHKWQTLSSSEEFNQNTAKATFPPAVMPVTDPNLHEILKRINWIRGGMVLDMTRHPDRYEYPFQHPVYSGAGSRYARLRHEDEQRDKKQEDQLKILRERVDYLERRSLSIRLRNLFRKLLKPFRD